MSKAKHYEIHLTKKQAFFSVLALMVCFLLAFSLGTITGMRYFNDTGTSLLISPTHNEPVTPSVADLGTLESHTVSNPEGDSVVHEFTFYDTLPENENTPVPQPPAERQKNRQEKPSSKKASSKNKKINEEGSPKNYTVQFGSFQQKEKAYALSNKLKKQGYLTHVTTTKIENKGTFYRVRMGSFSTQEEAQEWIAQLGAYSPPPFITSDTD